MDENLNDLHILGVLGGRDMSTEKISAWARSADVLLAADGGANLLDEGGILPDAVVGDMDSISESSKHKQSKLFYDPDQNSSDCDKLLAYATRCGYREISLCAVEGDLLDHVLGILQSAARSSLTVRLVLRSGVAWILRGPHESVFDLPLDARLSLLPISVCEGLSLEGTQWPLIDAALDPLGFTSLSNRVVGPVKVRLSNGVAALFVAHPSLEQPHWPQPR